MRESNWIPAFGGMTKMQGIKIETTSDFTSTYGFGSSSAVTVCTIKALAHLYGIKLTNQQLFDLAYKTVLDVQGAGSGFDIAAAIWGGTIYYTPPHSRHPAHDAGSQIYTKEIADQVRNDRMNIIVGYTGVKADTTILINKVKKLQEKDPDLVTTTLQCMGVIVKKAKLAMEKSDVKTVGTLMNENQTLLETLGVSTPELATLISAARNAGAYGAKLSGAGGGDCMIAVAPKEKRKDIERAIIQAGGEVLNVKVNAEGVKIEESQKILDRSFDSELRTVELPE